MISVGIIGGSGYTGKKLLQFCNAHPFVEKIKVYANSTAGEKLSAIFPDLINVIEDNIIESVSNISLDMIYILVRYLMVKRSIIFRFW